MQGEVCQKGVVGVISAAESRLAGDEVVVGLTCVVQRRSRLHGLLLDTRTDKGAEISRVCMER